MYLPSKFKLKFIGQIILITIAFFVFRTAILEVFFSLSRNVLFSSSSLFQTRDLQKENLILSLKLDKLRSLEEENKRLRRALNIKEEGEADLVCGTILGFYPSVYRRVVFIDSGKSNNIKKDMLAIDDRGFLVGRILEVYKNYSELVLLNDPYCSLPVLIEDKTTGFLKGTLSGAPKILYVENTQGVKSGDVVWVNYLGLPVTIGEITKVRENKGDFFLDIEVAVSANIYSLRQVFVLK